MCDKEEYPFYTPYLFSAFKESRGQALRDPLEHHFVLKISHFLGQVGPGRASPHATCKALNRYYTPYVIAQHEGLDIVAGFIYTDIISMEEHGARIIAHLWLQDGKDFLDPIREFYWQAPEETEFAYFPLVKCSIRPGEENLRLGFDKLLFEALTTQRV